MTTPLKSSVFDLLSPILEGEGIELVDVEHESQGKNTTLRLLIYKPDGITTKDCQHVSQISSPILEIHALRPDRCNLEVASPGLDRPLVTESDFRRNLGREIQIMVRSSGGKSSQLSGILKDVSQGQIFLTQPSGAIIPVGISVITNAQIQLTW